MPVAGRIPSGGGDSLAREIFAERKETIAKYVPTETQALYSRVIADLKETASPGGFCLKGAKLHASISSITRGNSVSSAELLERKRLVLCFFRSRWCPFCVGQLEAMNRILPRLQLSGASLAAISPQTVQQSCFMADQHKLQFPSLSDPGNHLARQFGLVRVPDDQQAVYQRSFINLPFGNGDGSWELPIPATFTLDRDATILSARADPDYTNPPEPEEILERLS